jgi:hypothetical protein
VQATQESVQQRPPAQTTAVAASAASAPASAAIAAQPPPARPPPLAKLFVDEEEAEKGAEEPEERNEWAERRAQIVAAKLREAKLGVQHTDGVCSCLWRRAVRAVVSLCCLDGHGEAARGQAGRAAAH